jgi:hypothetical protein
MLLDPEKFVQTETEHTNPMVTAVKYPGCPIDKVCAHLAVGSCAVVLKCDHFRESGFAGECTYGADPDIGKG